MDAVRSIFGRGNCDFLDPVDACHGLHGNNRFTMFAGNGRIGKSCAEIGGWEKLPARLFG